MKIKSIALLVAWLFFSTNITYSQSFTFGAKIGPSIGLQKWDSFERDPLFAFHGAAFIESYEEENPSSLFMQLGYHVRGSAIRNLGFSNTSNFRFNNLALVLGGKRIFSEKPKIKSYYMLGLRAEYTLNTNLEKFQESPNNYYPIDEFVKKFNYGFNVGAGMEFPFSEFVSGILELSINPDISKQYDQPPLENVIDPRIAGRIVDLPRREIRNVTVDLSLGIRFLRKVEYYD
jgi:hypothetical protein